MGKELTVIDQREVTFYGDELVAMRATDGQIYVSVRHLSEALGLTRQSQVRRIGRQPVLAAGHFKGAELVASGRGSSSVNQTMSAIRKLATEATDNGLLDPTVAAGIQRVKGVKQRGERAGNWLTKDQAQELINTPDILKVKGLRDRAILAVMVGAGLRRSEVAGLTFGHVQQRDGRWVIVDLVGKGGRVRTVPIPSWTKVALDEWAAAANLLYFGPVFRPINKGGKVADRPMTPQAIYNVVDEHAAAAGLEVTAHDLRRTFAKLAHKGGAALDQIQLTLGHASIQTTERYLGVEQNLQQAPCDVLGLAIGGGE